MIARKVLFGVAMSMLLVSASSPFSGTPYAQGSCAQELNRQDAALRSLNADAQGDVADLISTDVANTASQGLKKALGGDATADAVAAAKEKWDEWQDWVERTKLTKQILDEVAKCIGAGMRGCMKQIDANIEKGKQLLGESSDAWAEATKKWIDSLGNDSVSAAAERVDNARNVIERTANRSSGLFSEAATRGIDSCLRDFERRAQASPRDPVDLRTSQPSASQPTSSGPSGAGNSGGGSGASAGSGGGGIGAGTIIGLAAGGTAAAVGAYYIGETVRLAQCNTYEAEANSKLTNISNVGNSLVLCAANPRANCTSQQNALNNAISSLLTTLGNWCTCLGPSAGTALSAADKAAVQGAFADLRSLGVNPGTLPACFR